MTNVELKKQSVYMYRGKEGVSYFLVLGMSKYGYMYLKFRNNPEYSKIIGLDVDNIGYACIDNIMYSTWNRINPNKVAIYRSLSDQEYGLIVHAITQCMMNNICYADDGYLIYADEIIGYNIKLATSKPKEISIKKTNTTVVKKKHDNTPDNNNESNLEHKNEDIATSEPDTTPDENIMIQEIDIAPNEDTTGGYTITEFDPSEENDIIPEFDLMSNDRDSEEKPEGVKYYNLLEYDTKATYIRNGDTSASKTTKIGDNIYRHMYTEIEVLAIANMNTKAVKAKYGITSSSICALMIRNAKRIFDIEIKRITKTNNFKKLFNAGWSVEDIHKYTGVPINKIKENIKRYNLNNRNIDNKFAIQKWNDIINASPKDYSKLISIAFMKIIKLAEMENCSIPTAESIRFNVRNELFKNPLFVIGFEENAASTESINRYFEKLRKSSSKDAYEAAYLVYTKTMSLYDAYVSTYDNHSDIIVGAMPIPDIIPIQDRDCFISLLYNRFHYNKLADKNRYLNHEQKYVVDNNASMANYMIAFMVVNKTKAISIKTGYKRSVKSE